MRSRRDLALALASGLAVALFAACAGSGSPLANREEEAGGAAGAKAGASSAGAAGTSAGAAGKAGKAGGGQAGAGQGGDPGDGGAGAPADAPPDVFVEPDGPFELRLLSGIADAKEVRICLAAWDGKAALPSPVFAPTAVLGLGASELAKAPDVPVAVRPYVLSGAALATLGGDCAAIVSAPPMGLRVTPLPALPASLWTAKRSVVLVAAGCAGGVTLPLATNACGEPTSPTPSKASLVFAELSRAKVQDGAVGLQVLHASTSFGAVQVRVRQDGAEQPTILLSKVDPGDLETRPPLPVDPGVLGVVPETTKLELGDVSGASDLYVETLGKLFSASGIDTKELAAGHRFVAVVVGAKPSLGMGAGEPVRTVLLRSPE